VSGEHACRRDDLGAERHPIGCPTRTGVSGVR
jgi:hypothetical protein